MIGSQVSCSGPLSGVLSAEGTPEKLESFRLEFRATGTGVLKLRGYAFKVCAALLTRTVRKPETRRAVLEALRHLTYSKVEGVAREERGEIVLELDIRGRGPRLPRPIEARLRLILGTPGSFLRLFRGIRRVLP